MFRPIIVIGGDFELNFVTVKIVILGFLFLCLDHHSLMIYLAFRIGKLASPDDCFVMFATQGAFVHVELLVQNKKRTKAVACGAWDKTYPSFQARDPKLYMRQSNYVFLALPLVHEQENIALDYLASLVNSNLPYSTGWECVLPETVVDWIENDVDVNAPPSTWKQGVFCSQIALLFLRKMVLQGVLDKASWGEVLTMHSRHCSPTILYNLLKNKGDVKQVEEHCVFL